MGNQEYRLVGAPAHLQQQFLHLLTGKRIEGTEGFVHQQYAGVGSQRTGQAHALFLTAGQLPDPAFFKAGQIHQRKHFTGAGFALVPRHTRQFKAKCHVGQYVLPRQQHIVLKHHAALGARAVDRHVIEGDSPSAGLDETGNQIQQ